MRSIRYQTFMQNSFSANWRRLSQILAAEGTRLVHGPLGFFCPPHGPADPALLSLPLDPQPEAWDLASRGTKAGPFGAIEMQVILGLHRLAGAREKAGAC